MNRFLSLLVVVAAIGFGVSLASAEKGQDRHCCGENKKCCKEGKECCKAEEKKCCDDHGKDCCDE